jgi:hypothetical protein
VLISRADIESPLTRVRRVELIDAVENEVQGGADPAFKAVLLTPRESTGRPMQPALAGLVVIDKADAPQSEKTPEKQESNATTPGAAFHLQNAPDPTSKDHLNDKVRPREEPKAKQLATIPEARSVASTPPQTVHGPKTAASTPPRSFGPADIAATRAFTRF